MVADAVAAERSLALRDAEPVVQLEVSPADPDENALLRLAVAQAFEP